MIDVTFRDGTTLRSTCATLGTRYVPGLILFHPAIPLPPRRERAYLVLDRNAAYDWSVVRRALDATLIERIRGRLADGTEGT